MNCFTFNSSVSSVYLLIAIISISISTSSARELRPSNHGLANQTDPPSSTDEMQSFFAANSSTPDQLALPKPTDSSNPDWWKKGDESRKPHQRGGGGSAKKILLITSVVCGIAGVGFLLAAALVFAFRSRVRNSLGSSSTQLVVK